MRSVDCSSLKGQSRRRRSITFSAAGPNVPSIQGSVDAFRAVGLYRHGVP